MLIPMRFWFEHSGEVPLREQIVAQVQLGILCGELAAGERLPSIRELARRFGVHANTVSMGYRQLEAEGWVASRRGSGVYVLSGQSAKLPAADTGLDRLIQNLFAGARRLGLTDEQVRDRVTAWSQRALPNCLLLVEPDAELRRILLAELAQVTPLPVAGCSFEDYAARHSESHAGALVVTLPSKLERVQAIVSATRVHCLRVRSVPVSLVEHLPPVGARAGVLLGVASRWSEFLRFARTMLVAAGFEGDALIVRDAREPHWQDGLAQATAVVCDLVTAQKLAGVKTTVSRILADDVAAELAQRQS